MLQYKGLWKCAQYYPAIAIVWLCIRTTPHQDNSPPCRYIGPDVVVLLVDIGLVGSCPSGE